MMGNAIKFIVILCFAWVANSDLYAQDHENVEQVGRIYNQWGDALDGEVVDSLAYVVTGLGGLQIVDISDPENLEVISTIREGGLHHGVHFSGDYAYVAKWSDGLHIISIEDPEHPEVVGFYETDEYTRSVALSGDYAYTVGSAAATVLVSDPENPQEVGHYDAIIGARDIWVDGDYAFISASNEGRQDNNDGRHIISIVNPKQLREVGYFDISEANRFTVSDELAYVTNTSTGTIRILSISDPDQVNQVGTISLLRAYEIAISDDYAYVASYTSGLNVVGIIRPENPINVGHYDTLGTAYGVAVSGDYAYVADLDAGLRVISINDPETPDEVSFYNMPSHALDVAISGEYAYVADSYGGLRVISIANPYNLAEVGYFDTSGNAKMVTLSEDGLIYVADGSNLGISRFTDPPRPDIDVSADTLFFSEVEIDSSDTQMITLFNNGEANLSIRNLIIESELFSTNFDTAFQLEQESNREIAIIFSPDTVGLIEESLIVVSDDIFNDSLIVTLLGNMANAINEDQVIIPAEFNLYATYPNPFNSSATITYALPRASSITLQVYNLS